MNSSSKIPLIWSYLTFLFAFGFFFVADEKLMPRYLSVILGALSSIIFFYYLKKSKPYIYECKAWKCFIIILMPMVLFIFFNRTNQEFMASIFGSIMFFNLIVFFFYKIGADFSDIENTLSLDNVVDRSSINNLTSPSLLGRDKNSISNLFLGSNQEKKEVMRKEIIGQTARFVADSFYTWALNYNLEMNKSNNLNSGQNDVEKVAYHAIESRVAIEGDHQHKVQILKEYMRSPNNGLLDLVISILKIEAELHLNERVNIEMYLEVIYEELKTKHINSTMIFGHEGLDFKNTLKSLTNFALSDPASDIEFTNVNNTGSKTELDTVPKSKIYFSAVTIQIMMSLISIRDLTEDQKITSAIFFDRFKVLVLGSEFETGVLSEDEILLQTMQLSNLNKKITARHFDKARYLVHELRDKKAIDVVNKTTSYSQEIFLGNVKKPFLRTLIEDSKYQWDFN